MAEIQVGGVTQLQITHSDRFKVELAKGQKGSYGWTITTYGQSLEEVIANLELADSALKARYGNNTTE